MSTAEFNGESCAGAGDDAPNRNDPGGGTGVETREENSGMDHVGDDWPADILLCYCVTVYGKRKENIFMSPLPSSNCVLSPNANGNEDEKRHVGILFFVFWGCRGSVASRRRE